MSDELKNQTNIAKIQIYSTLTIAIGVTGIGISVTLALAIITIMGTTEYSQSLENLVNSLINYAIMYGIFSIACLIIGVCLPTHQLKKISKNN